ncbi:hypothetical protein AB1N83_012825 [Pleurotus pulmonarius]
MSSNGLRVPTMFDCNANVYLDPRTFSPLQTHSVPIAGLNARTLRITTDSPLEKLLSPLATKNKEIVAMCNEGSLKTLQPVDEGTMVNII